MATIIENNCVGCEICYHCGRREEENIVCDKCGCDAYYSIGEDDYCEDCFEDELNAQWDAFSTIEKAEALSITYEKLG